MSCPDLPIRDVDGILYLRLVQQAIRAGATKDDDDHWHIQTGLGEVLVSVRLDIPSCTLHVTTLKKPPLYTCGMVREKIVELIENAKEAS